MPKTLLICKDPKYYCHEYDLVFYWESFDESYGAYSIPKVVEEESEDFRNLYLDWLYRFGRTESNGKKVVEHLLVRNDFSYWWMTLLIEKSQWKSEGLYKVFRLMALNKLLTQHDIEEIDIKLSDKCVHKSIDEYCTNNKIKLNTRCLSFPVFNILFYIFHAFFVFLSYLILIKFSFRKKNKQRKVGRITFFSYFFNLDDSALNKDIFYTRYWTSLHNLILSMNYSVNWIHIFLKSDSAQTVRKAEALVDRFNNNISNQLHILLDGDIRWGVVKKTAQDYFKLVITGCKLRSIKKNFTIPGFDFDFWYVLQQDWNRSIFGATAIENCLYLNLFEHTLKHFPRQEKGFYLLEGQAWERGLIYAWKNAGHGEIIGVQHTAVSYWDLRNFFSPKEYNFENSFKLPMPDLVALNGGAASKMYIAGKFPVEKIICLEALRYLYLNNINTTESNLSDKKGKVRLLVLGDYSPKVTDKQLQLLFNISNEIKPLLKIILKPHPANRMDINKYKKHDLDIEITYNALDLLLDKCDIAFSSCSTAAAVDTYLSGKKTLIMIDPGMFNMSPLRGFLGVEYIYTSSDLLSSLQDMGQAKHEEYTDFFYVNDDLSRWKNIIN